MTRFYGLKPPDIDAMSLREVSEYITSMDRWNAEHPEGE